MTKLKKIASKKEEIFFFAKKKPEKEDICESFMKKYIFVSCWLLEPEMKTRRELTIKSAH